jgi:hypothetical protein
MIEFGSDESACQIATVLFRLRHASRIQQIGILYRYSLLSTPTCLIPVSLSGEEMAYSRQGTCPR